MKKLLFISLLLPCFSFGQNLVINPSFEDTISCPTGNTGQMDKVVSWYQTTLGTPDYCHECKGTVPLSAAYQYARTGAAYTGIIGYWIVKPDYREYISVPLIGPLDAGKTYYAEMYVSLSNYSQWATDMMGIFLSNGAPDTTGIGSGVFTVTPQISNPTGNFLSDTVNWTKISGTFVAAGGEDYITIGSFMDDVGTDTLFMGGGALNFSYYVIEDVVVREDTTVGRKETIDNYQITIYPNPTTGKFTVQGASAEIQIFDLIGKLVLRSNKAEIDMSSYPVGIYFVKTGQAVRKLIVQ